LTEKGEDLFATIIALRQWGDRWLFPKGKYPADMLDGRDQSPVARIEVRSGQGRKVTLANLTLKARRASKSSIRSISRSKKV
jgi:hypothetical protein